MMMTYDLMQLEDRLVCLIGARKPNQQGQPGQAQR
jgi:hypothetical protein